MGSILPKHSTANGSSSAMANGHSRGQSMHFSHHKRGQSLAAITTSTTSGPSSSSTAAAGGHHQQQQPRPGATLWSFFCGSRRVVVFVCASLAIILLLSTSTSSEPKSTRGPPASKVILDGGKGAGGFSGLQDLDEVEEPAWRRPLRGAVDWLGDRLGHAPSSSSLQSYRDHLEATTSPPHFNTHSPTLSFSHIYVLSLPTRPDRRARMDKLARALGLELTYVDAITKDRGVIRWIGERVEEIRKRKAPVVAKALGKTAKEVGGMTPCSDWLFRSDWEGENRTAKFPSLVEDRWGKKDWVRYLVEHGPDGLDAKDGRAFDVATRLHDPLERIAQRQLSEGSLAVWYGQTSVMREVIRNGDESALVLEDDVDLEWDIERLWASIYRRLPKASPGNASDGWQIAFLGHCWGRESTRPQYNHPLLHQSSEPRCLHAWAVSAWGARRLLQLLSDPWMAYQTAVDIAIPTFIVDGLLGPTGAFSVDPQLIVQAKELTSDISSGTGSPWRGLLMDSTWERILKDEGFDVPEPVFSDGPRTDPATKFRVKYPDFDDPEEAFAAEASKAAEARKAGQEKARLEALNREVFVEGVNAPAKAPSKKLPAAALGKDGKKAAEVFVDPRPAAPAAVGGMVKAPKKAPWGGGRKQV